MNVDSVFIVDKPVISIIYVRFLLDLIWILNIENELMDIIVETKQFVLTWGKLLLMWYRQHI